MTPVFTRVADPAWHWTEREMAGMRLRPLLASALTLILLDGRGADDLMKAFAAITKTPMAFVIGRDGAICRKHSGFASPETFERDVTALF